MIGGAFGVTLANARTGDEAAFACIFHDVQPALLRYLRVITAEPEDVAGETWIQVRPGATQSPAQSGPSQNRASPGSLPFPWPLPLATKGCPAGTTPYQETHASGR